MSHQSVFHVENIYTRLITTDRELLERLHNILRFRPKNFWHNIAYKKKKWDGWKDFFDDKSGRFLTGLLPVILKALKKLDKPYTIIDKRERINWLHSSIDDQFLNQWLPPGKDPITLHDFQPDLANRCFEYQRGLVQAPTGAGKTFIMISVLKSLPPKTPVLFLAKSASLVHQNWQEMKDWGVENLGRWYDGHKEPNFVMCATIHHDTLKSIQKLLPKFKVVLVDEAHETMCDVSQGALRKMTSACVRLGFTATPFKWDKRKIEQVHKYSMIGYYGPQLKTETTESGLLTTKDLQIRNILAKSDCHVYPVDHPNLAYEPYADAVELGIAQNFHFHDIVKRLSQTCTGRTLIVVERIAQGEYLEQLIPGSTFIQGKNSLKSREPILQALKKGDRCVAIVMRHIITAGINIKIHDLINAAGGDAAHNIIQLMGRGLRPADDKDLLRYHDFMFLINDYLRQHSEWRVDVLRNEGHDVKVWETIEF